MNLPEIAKVVSDTQTVEDMLDILDMLVEINSESSAEVEYYQQSTSAGLPWRIIAKELEKSIERIRRRILESGYPLDG